jgi:hypothetical protein
VEVVVAQTTLTLLVAVVVQALSFLVIQLISQLQLGLA